MNKGAKMEIELKNCPFCNEKPYLSYETHGGIKMVYCPNNCTPTMELDRWNYRPAEKMELDEKKLRNFINEQEIPLNNLYGDRLAKAICRTFSHPQVKLPKKFVCCCKHISGVGEVKCICGASYFNAALDKVREMNGGEK